MKPNPNTFKKLVDFNGRAGEKEFLKFWSICALISLTAIIADYLLDTRTMILNYGIFYSLYLLLYILPFFAVLVRRLHDICRSGWWALGWLIPIIGWIGLLIVTFTEGKRGANQYGPDPREPSLEEIEQLH